MCLARENEHGTDFESLLFHQTCSILAPSSSKNKIKFSFLLLSHLFFIFIATPHYLSPVAFLFLESLLIGIPFSLLYFLFFGLYN